MQEQSPIENIERIIISEQERKRKLADYVRTACARGWLIESQNEFNAVLFKGEKCNHTLHGLLTIIGGILTCGLLFLWGIAWIVFAFTQYQERMILSIDEYGEIITQTARI